MHSVPPDKQQNSVFSLAFVGFFDPLNQLFDGLIVVPITDFDTQVVDDSAIGRDGEVDVELLAKLLQGGLLWHVGSKAAKFVCQTRTDPIGEDS
jgi:hypothetical protein